MSLRRGLLRYVLQARPDGVQGRRETRGVHRRRYELAERVIVEPHAHRHALAAGCRVGARGLAAHGARGYDRRAPVVLLETRYRGRRITVGQLAADEHEDLRVTPGRRAALLVDGRHYVRGLARRGLDGLLRELAYFHLLLEVRLAGEGRHLVRRGDAVRGAARAGELHQHQAD